MILIAGLGNKGEEYKNSRHNTGFVVLDNILGKVDWNESSKANALYYKDSIKKKEVEYLKPLTFMNNSGVSVLCEQTKLKVRSQNIIVIHDDMDLPIGTLRISFDRSSGGHRGVESIIKKIKSQEFIRIRIGVSPVTPSGKLRKPKGEEAILKFLLGKFKEDELKEIKKVSKKVAEIVEMIVTESKEKAMSVFN
jgi:peptidyl-tRNA hydrolase, PTH1 family